MIISLVVAVAENGIIGADGGLPWKLSTDLRLFRRLTLGKPVVMGRRTFQSLKKPLDLRDNIVISSDPAFEPPAGVSVVATPTEALTLARVLARTGSGADEIMVIGGAGVFRSLLPVADRIYWTEVHASPAGDVSFPPFDAAGWLEVSREPLERGPKDEHAATLRVLERVASPAASDAPPS